MDNPMQDMMSEATRLVQEGRLSDATAAIQRALGGGFAPTTAETNWFSTPTRTVDEEVIDAPPTRTLPDPPSPRPGKRPFRRSPDWGRVDPAAWKTDFPKPGNVPAGPAVVAADARGVRAPTRPSRDGRAGASGPRCPTEPTRPRRHGTTGCVRTRAVLPNGRGPGRLAAAPGRDRLAGARAPG